MAKGTVSFDIIGHDRSGSAAFLKVAAAANRADGALDKFGRNTNKMGSSVDRLSGRLELIAKSAAVLGPSLAPIGAVAVPALAGLANQAGFAAVAAGTMVLAFQGVGDTLTAVNKAALEPTQKNLNEARLAMEKLSPAGRDLVGQLQAMRPVLTALRDAGQEAAFPGLIEGLESLTDLAPKVNAVITQVAGAVGDLFAEGAESLASDRWADFFATLASEARPTLESMASAIGSVAHGLSELWEGFAPLNRDFGTWLADAARSFDQWASGVSETEGFAEFVAYVRTNGPKVADAAAAIGDAMLQIVQAAAPLGGPVLEAITGVAEALGAIADSPIGTPLMVAVTAMSALSLASKAATTSVTRLSTAMAGLGASGGAAGAAGAASKGGPAGLIVLGIANQLLNLQDVFEQTQNGSMGFGEGLVRSMIPGINALETLGIKIPGLTSDADAAAASAEELAADLEYMKHVTGGGWDTSGVELLHAALGRAADEADNASRGMVDFTRSAARAMGILGQQAAMDAFHEAVDNARKTFKEFGKGLDGTVHSGRQSRAALRGIAESALKAAEGLKGVNRADFLKGASDQIAKWAEKMGMGERAAERFARRVLGLNDVTGAPHVDLDDKQGRRKVMQMLRDMDLLDGTHANPAVDLLIQQFLQGKVSVERMMRLLNGLSANPNVGADTGSAISSINAVESRLRALNGDEAHTYVYTHFRRTGSGQGQSASPNDGGGGGVGVGRLLAPEATEIERALTTSLQRFNLAARGAGGRAFKGIGEGIVRGLLQGLNSGNANQAERAVDRMMQAIARALKDKKITEAAARRMRETVNEMAREAERLQKKLAERLDFSRTLKDSFSGELNLGSLLTAEGGFTGVGGITGNLQGLAARLRNFAGQLRDMRKAGIPRGLIAEIASLGSDQGTQIAQAILSADGGSQSALSQAFNAFQSAAGQASMAGANAVYGTVREIKQENRITVNVNAGPGADGRRIGNEAAREIEKGLAQLARTEGRRLIFV